MGVAAVLRSNVVLTSAAALANVIYNTTGVRVRDHQITLDKLPADLPHYS